MPGDNEIAAVGFLSGVLRGFVSGRQLKQERQERDRQMSLQEARENRLQEAWTAEQAAQEEQAMAAEQERARGEIMQDVARELAPTVRMGERLPQRLARRLPPEEPPTKEDFELQKLGVQHGYKMEQLGAESAGKVALERERQVGKEKEPAGEDKWVYDQIRRWQLQGSVGERPVEWTDESGAKMKQPPEFLEQIARYKYARAQSGAPITDQEAYAEVQGVNNLTQFLGSGQAGPARQAWQRISKGDSTMPLFKGFTIAARIPELADYVEGGQTYDLEDLARISGYAGVSLEDIIALLFKPSIEGMEKGVKALERQQRAAQIPPMQGAPETAAMMGQ